MQWRNNGENHPENNNGYKKKKNGEKMEWNERKGKRLWQDKTRDVVFFLHSLSHPKWLASQTKRSGTLSFAKKMRLLCWCVSVSVRVQCARCRFGQAEDNILNCLTMKREFFQGNHYPNPSWIQTIITVIECLITRAVVPKIMLYYQLVTTRRSTQP